MIHFSCVLADILRRLPGVTTHNIGILTRHVKSLRDLAQMSLDALSGLIGAPNATKLHAFMHADANKFILEDT
jgi:ERCC4-type nuclease